MAVLQKPLTRRLAALGSVGALVLALAACGSSDDDSSTDDSTGGSTPSTATVTPVKFMLDYGVDASTAGLAWASQKGIFTQNNLNVKIEPGSGSEITEQTLEQGKADIGFVDLNVYLEHRLDGANSTTAVWAYGDTPSTSLLTLKKYDTPQSLAGITFGTSAGSSGIQAVQTVLSDNGMKQSDVKIVLLDYSVLYKSLFSGKVDSAEFHMGGDEGALIEAKKEGLDPQVEPLSKWGLVGYPQTLVVNNDFLKAHPDAVKEFIASLAAGDTASAAASDADVTKALQTLDPTIEEDATSLGRKDLTQIGSGSSTIDPSVIEKVMGQLEKASGKTTTLATSDLYTNDYAPQ